MTFYELCFVKKVWKWYKILIDPGVACREEFFGSRVSSHKRAIAPRHQIAQRVWIDLQFAVFESPHLVCRFFIHLFK